MGRLAGTPSEVKRSKRLPEHELRDNLQRSPSLSDPPVHSPLKRLLRPAFLALLAPLTVAVLGACGDDGNFTQDATTTNVIDTADVYALSGSAPEKRAAYELGSGTFVRPLLGELSGIVNFDIAFDINGEGKAVFLPVRALVPFAPAPASGAPSVGLLKSTSSFDVIQKAPTRGYVLDTAQVAAVGETYLMKLVTAGCIYGEPLYAKFVIDSIFPAQRRMVVRVLANRNCGGYRSLTAGLPKD